MASDMDSGDQRNSPFTFLAKDAGMSVTEVEEARNEGRLVSVIEQARERKTEKRAHDRAAARLGKQTILQVRRDV